MPDPCPFCELDTGRLIKRDALTATLRDGFAVTEGHSLVVPIRHVASLFELSTDELHAVWEAVAALRHMHARELGVTAFNVGINDGADAGQTVAHAHVHVIPRRPGDVADPRGGVRWVVPDRAAWWKTP